MATLSVLAATLADWAKRVDPDGKVDRIVEILNKTNEILDDMLFIESNLPTGHRSTVRTGLPSVTWRMLNYGVQPSKGTTKQVTDAIGMLEAYAEVDKDLADLNGNTAEFRISEDRGFLEAMSQEMASTVWYGDTTADPEQFMGMAPRFATISTDTTNIGYNIIDCGGTGSDNTSMWLVTWDELTCAGLFPKGKKAGLQHTDLGEVTLEDTASPAGKYQGYRSHYKWDCGLLMRDWRYVVRLANLDASDLAAFTDSTLDNFMIKAINRLPSKGMGKMVFYCNSTVQTYLDVEAKDTANVHLKIDEYGGKPVTKFLGIPVKRSDALLNTEARVT